MTQMMRLSVLIMSICECNLHSLASEACHSAILFVLSERLSVLFQMQDSSGQSSRHGICPLRHEHHTGESKCLQSHLATGDMQRSLCAWARQRAQGHLDTG